MAMTVDIKAVEAVLNTEWLSTYKAAERLGVSRQVVETLADAGRLASIRLPLMRGARLISVESVDGMMEKVAALKAAEAAVRGER